MKCAKTVETPLCGVASQFKVGQLNGTLILCLIKMSHIVPNPTSGYSLEAFCFFFFISTTYLSRAKHTIRNKKRLRTSEREEKSQEIKNTLRHARTLQAYHAVYTDSINHKNMVSFTSVFVLDCKTNLADKERAKLKRNEEKAFTEL